MKNNFNLKGTYFLIIVNVVVFVISFGGNILTDSFGNYYGYIFFNHEWYRLFSCMFLHAGISHLVCNMIALLEYGFIVENTYGTCRFLELYILSGLGASFISALFNMVLSRDIISVGASGAICGLLGVVLADIKGDKKGKLINIIIGVVPLFIIGISPGIDNFAHFGGVFIGYILGRIFRKKGNLDE